MSTRPFIKLTTLFSLSVIVLFSSCKKDQESTKSNTTVMSDKGQWVEVQIRSKRMDDIAEKGYAAHWKYKDNVANSDQGLEMWIGKVREILSQNDTSAIEFVDDFRSSLFQDEVFHDCSLAPYLSCCYPWLG